MGKQYVEQQKQDYLIVGSRVSLESVISGIMDPENWTEKEGGLSNRVCKRERLLESGKQIKGINACDALCVYNK